MGHWRSGGQARDPPAGDGRDRRRESRVARAPAATEGEGGDTRAFSGELQPAGGGGIQPPHFADDAGEAAMAQPFLHDRQNGAAGIDAQHPVRGEAGLRQGGREEVSPFRRPEHRAVETREDAGDHQPGGGRVFRRGAGIGEFMQAPEAQAPAR